MYTLEVKNLGIKFILRHQKTDTLLETIINFISRKNHKRNSGPYGTEDFWPLKNISFCVREGASLGVIGRNGAGKSTLLKLLSGIYLPDEGTVSIKGTVGLLQIETCFHQDLTGRENIYLNGAMLGLKKKEIDAKYDSIVDFSEIEYFIDTPIKYYSAGMRARLGFAIAINIKPDILLIDEVLSVGDEGFKKKCRHELEKLREMKKTIVLVTHALNEVESICDRSICLDHGNIIYEGASSDANKFYKDFIDKIRADHNPVSL